MSRTSTRTRSARSNEAVARPGPTRTAFARTDYDLVGESHGAFSLTDPAYDQPGYEVLNGSVGINRGGLMVSLYVKNLLDNSKIITRPSINFNEEAYTLRPLTAGVYATMKL